MKRKKFLEISSKAGMLSVATLAFPHFSFDIKAEPFKIALNQWSLMSSYIGKHEVENFWAYFVDLVRTDPKKLLRGELDPIDFPRITRELYGLDAIEIESSLYYGEIDNIEYFKEFKKRCDDYGVKCLFISNVWGGNLASLEKNKAKDVAENYYKWIDMAAYLGCHSLMVDMNGRKGDKNLVKEAAIEGLSPLVEYAQKSNISIITENHNWFSADAAWLIDIVKSINSQFFKLNVDFGNFCPKGGTTGKCVDQYDPYEGVKLLMPYANAVSAKTFHFDDEGNDLVIDYPRMLKIVRESGYNGYLGIEYSGNGFSDQEGIKKTIELIKKYSD